MRSGCSGRWSGSPGSPGTSRRGTGSCSAFSDGLSMICCSRRANDFTSAFVRLIGGGSPLTVTVSVTRGSSLKSTTRVSLRPTVISSRVIGPEAGHRRGDRVAADLHERRAVDAGFVRHHRALGAGIHVSQRDRHAGKHAATRVRDRSLDRAGDGLSKRGRAEDCEERRAERAADKKLRHFSP